MTPGARMAGRSRTATRGRAGAGPGAGRRAWRAAHTWASSSSRSARSRVRPPGGRGPGSGGRGGRALAADAAEGLAYDPGPGAQMVEAAGGAVFLAGIMYLGFKLFTKRADFATSVRLASKLDDGLPPAAPAEERKDPLEGKTAKDALVNAATAFGISFALYNVAVRVDDYFTAQEAAYTVGLGFTARRVALLFKTVVTSLGYFAAFIYGANAAGLLGLGIQMAVDPDGLKDPEAEADAAARAAGPRRLVVDDIAGAARELEAAAAAGDPEDGGPEAAEEAARRIEELAPELQETAREIQAQIARARKD